MKLFYSDHIELQAKKGSTFPTQKYRLLREHLQQNYANRFEFIAATPASNAALCLAHEAEYILAIESGDLSSEAIRRIGFPWSSQLVARSKCSVAATINACEAALKDGAAANLAGGTHHAFRHFGAGYCVFNDVATASLRMRELHPNLRILIVDVDVHQGDGTAAILANEPNIYTFSIHCMDNFPARKQCSDLDVPLMAGTGDKEYLRQFKDALRRAWLAARPDFVIYLAGADPFEGDRLGRLALSMGAMKQRDEALLSECRRRFIPVALAMGGGYAERIEDIISIHAQTIVSAADLCSSGAKEPQQSG
ncbi:MAG: histone deacetylase [Pseudomonadota bacterium]